MNDISSLKPEVLKALQAVDTPTVCNALDIVMDAAKVTEKVVTQEELEKEEEAADA